VGSGGQKGVLAGRRDVGGQPFAHQPTLDESRHAQLVLDYQDPHARILPLRDERRMNKRQSSNVHLAPLR
jgi:hypothetical protein